MTARFEALLLASLAAYPVRLFRQLVIDDCLDLVAGHAEVRGVLEVIAAAQGIWRDMVYVFARALAACWKRCIPTLA